MNTVKLGRTIQERSCHNGGTARTAGSVQALGGFRAIQEINKYWYLEDQQKSSQTYLFGETESSTQNSPKCVCDVKKIRE